MTQHKSNLFATRLQISGKEISNKKAECLNNAAPDFSNEKAGNLKNDGLDNLRAELKTFSTVHSTCPVHTAGQISRLKRAFYASFNNEKKGGYNA